MGSDIRGFDNKEVYTSNQSNSYISVKLPGAGIGFYIEKFPKEFKKGFFRTFDKRFAIILFLSFVINIGAILYLENNFDFSIDDKTISKIQQQYANLLLERDYSTSINPQGLITTDYQKDSQVITSLAQWMDNLSVDFFKSLDYFETPALPMAAQGTIETKGTTREERADMRASSAQRRSGSREALEREVSAVGLLGLISTNSNNLDYEYVQDLLEYASNNSEDLTQVLSKLNTIEVPRYGGIEYLGNLKGGSGSGLTPDLKGSRVIADNEINKIVSNIQPLNKPKTETIARNVQYEEVKSSYLNRALKAGKAGVERTNADVVRIVKSHMRALQDCYKQELKSTPDLKGKIIVRFSINPEGEVVQAGIVSSTLENAQMERCILKRINQWKNFTSCDPMFGNKSYRQSFKFGM